jgi:hypothetical protein
LFKRARFRRESLGRTRRNDFAAFLLALSPLAALERLAQLRRRAPSRPDHVFADQCH